MKPNVSWQFSCPVNQIDVLRILREAGPETKCVRLTVDGKVYTIVNGPLCKNLPAPNRIGAAAQEFTTNQFDGYRLRRDTFMSVSTSGEPLICGSGLERATKWVLYTGDRTGEVMQRVKTTVEVF